MKCEGCGKELQPDSGRLEVDDLVFCDPICADACESLVVCEHCGNLFDYDTGGHIDEATGLAFCDAHCEARYDRKTGLPDGYQMPPETIDGRLQVRIVGENEKKEVEG